MALLTVADVAKATGLTITAGSAEADQCQFFVDTVSAYIAEIVDALFEETEITARLQADYDGIIVLPSKPVVSVDSVKTTAGETRVGWEFDGIDEIDHVEAHEILDVTFTAGYAAPPQALVQIAISAAARQMLNPAGMRQQTVGAISETWATGDGMAGSVFFTPMEKEVLAKYQSGNGTLHLGPRDYSWRSILPVL